MKIEHVAIWAKDIDKVCDFYRKYFNGEVQPLYHNPAKQFTSRFVTFEGGARLEVMHRPDVGTVTSLQSYTHRSANEKMRAFFRFLTSAVFHVKPYEPSVAEHTCMFYDRGDYGRPMAKPEAQHEQGECSAHTCMGIAEPQDVGHEVSQHLGLTHLSFSVGSKEGVDRLTQKMSEDGIQVVGQPRTTGDGYYESVVLDPEGNRVEVTV